MHISDLKYLGLLAGLLLASWSASTWAAEVKIKTNDRIIFLGDSITQAGDEPGGYVTLVRKTVAKRHPDLSIEIIGAGISGNRVGELLERLDRDVIQKEPTKVIVYIGINDVWNLPAGTGTPIDEFGPGLSRVVDEIRAADAEVVLCTASVIGEKTDGSNELDEALNKYSEICRQVARDKQVALVDLRHQFLEQLEQINPEQDVEGHLTTDGVHLNRAGNEFVAQQMIAALGIDEASLLRHVVLFRFKRDATPEQIVEIERAFGDLPGKIPEIRGYEWGINNSPEGLNNDFTHCFLVTFGSEADREKYLPHPAHKEFVELLLPKLDKAFVFDYWAKP
ncbi:Dabb family protein [Pirellulales bacterium]|nr:Dabb family protein [Pirellulales bacterium]